MISPRSDLNHQANVLYEAIRVAYAAGFRLTVDKHGFIDLADQNTGESTPVTAALLRERK